MSFFTELRFEWINTITYHVRLVSPWIVNTVLFVEAKCLYFGEMYERISTIITLIDSNVKDNIGERWNE